MEGVNGIRIWDEGGRKQQCCVDEDGRREELSVHPANLLAAFPLIKKNGVRGE